MNSSKITQLMAPGLRALQPYVPGKPLSELEGEYGLSASIKLASNENPYGPGALARQAMSASLADIGLYPDGGGFDLKVKLARRHDVAPECITLGNGSNDLLVMLAEAFLTADTEAVYSQYGFAVYPLVVQATGAIARVAPALPEGHAMALGHDLTAFARLVTPQTRLVFIANPNNPTGTWLDGENLRDFVRSMPPTTLVVLDEAYYEYGRELGCPDATAWLAECPNLVVLRTFSKAHGLAGLRVGYALSSPEVAEVLNRIRQPFNVNSIALAAASAALDDDEHIQRSVQLNNAGREALRNGLAALGLASHPSAGNFVLVDIRQNGAAAYESLLRRGVIVRPLAGYGLPDHLRVTIGTLEENQRFLAALAATLGRDPQCNGVQSADSRRR